MTGARLSELREMVAKKARLEALLTELGSQKESLERRVRDLRYELDGENADVERLEKTTLTSFLMRAIGKIDEKLDRERREAYAAKLKYDTAVAELEGVLRRIEESQAELKSVRGVDIQYKNAVKEKIEAIRAAGGESGEKLARLEERAVFLAKNITELKEAIEAGKRAKSIISEVEYKLDHALNMATRDMFGGGMIAHVSKHNALDEAQNLVEYLQMQLRRFKTELADVSIDADFRVNIDGFMRTADWFFDGFFVDLEVRSRIENARREIAVTDSRLNVALRTLDGLLDKNTRESQAVTADLELLAVNTEA